MCSCTCMYNAYTHVHTQQRMKQLVLSVSLCVYLFVCLCCNNNWILYYFAGANRLIPNGTVCTCSGVEVVYECSVCSGATTLWSGTTLDCVANGIITLRHNSDNFQPGTFDYCNGEITSEIVGIKENCYISRVNFTTVARFNNTSIDCSLQDPIRSSIGNSTIFIPGISMHRMYLIVRVGAHGH